MKTNISASLRQVIVTLNGVEVKGEGNMDRLLGSIQALKSLVVQVEKEIERESKEEPP